MEEDYRTEPDYDVHIVHLMNADLDDVFPEIEEEEIYVAPRQYRHAPYAA